MRRSVLGLAIVALASCFDWAALSPTTTLELDGGCAALGAPSGGSISMSGMAFTVAFWMQLDTATSGPIVWQGGTAVGEAGWSFSVASGPKISFCLANETTAPRCVQAPITLHHAIHVAATTTPGTVDFTRVVNLYMLDATMSQTTHSLVGMDNAAVNTWSSSSVFTLGGAFADGGCTRTSPVTLGGVRVWSSAVDVPTLDQNLGVGSACDGGVADFRLEEGSGATARDCNKNEPPLTLIQPFAWVTSPFL